VADSFVLGAAAVAVETAYREQEKRHWRGITAQFYRPVCHNRERLGQRQNADSVLISI
jgi:hypothetical protein